MIFNLILMFLKCPGGHVFLNLGALEGGLRSYDFSGLPGGGRVEATYIGGGNRVVFGFYNKHEDGD